MSVFTAGRLQHHLQGQEENMTRTENEQQRYEKRKERLDRKFKWTEERLAKLRALNDSLLELQEEIISRTKRLNDEFSRLERTGFDFIHGYKIIGSYEFEKQILDLDYDDESELDEETREALERWTYLSDNSETSIWKTVFDSLVGDFLPTSKILTEHLTNGGWQFDLPDDCDIKICSFLELFYKYNRYISMSDLIECERADFYINLSISINGKIEELSDKNEWLREFCQPDGDDIAKILFHRQCILNRNFEWSKEHIEKILKVNEWMWRLTAQGKENMTKLADVLRELGKTDAFFKEFRIEGTIRYHSEKPTDIATAEIQQKLRKYGEHSFWWTLTETESGKDCDTIHEEKDFDCNWNFEVYRRYLSEEQRKIPFHYLMHCVFIDGYTYSFEDLIRMEEDGLVFRYDIDLDNWGL